MSENCFTTWHGSADDDGMEITVSLPRYFRWHWTSERWVRILPEQYWSLLHAYTNGMTGRCRLLKIDATT